MLAKIVLELLIFEEMVCHRIRVTSSDDNNINSLSRKELQSSSNLGVNLLLVVGVCAVSIYVNEIHTKPNIYNLSFTALLIFVTIMFRSKSAQDINEVVEILPNIGVQLYSNDRIDRFIACEDVIDVIISENILSFKVVSKVCLRIKSFSDDNNVEIVHLSLPRKTLNQLVRVSE